ncbi:MAG: beta-mannanase [Spirochaetaceae bacterium]|nr:MAG: beta-mannanase [Spirochaetaceae bacterium]
MRNHDVTTPGGFATGCNYWASHAGTMMWSDWKPEVVDADLVQLASSGLTTVRVFPLWPVFQPLSQTYGGAGRPHDLRFGESPLPDTCAGRAGVSEEAMERFGYLADRAEAHGIRLIVGLVTGWMSGRLFVPPAFERLNVLTDPMVRRWTLRFVRYFVSRMKEKPAIAYWDLGNECNCMAHVDSPDRAYEWTASVAGAIRVADPTRPVVSGMHSLGPGQNALWRIQDQGELTDVLTTHPYPIFTPHCNQEPVDSIRNAFHATAESRFYGDIAGRPCFAEELGTLGPEVASESIAASYLTNALWNLWAHDCRGMLWWCAYDQDLLTHAPYDWNGHERELGLFRNDRSPKPMQAAISRFVEAIESTGVTLPPFRRDAVCILTEGQDQWGAAYAAFILAKQAGFDIEFQWAEQPLKDAQLYIVPSAAGAHCIDSRLHHELMARVERGASLYLSHDGCFLGWFRETFGVEIQSRVAAPAEVELELDGARITIGGSVSLSVEPTGATAIGAPSSGAVGFTKHRIGKGSTYLLTAPLERFLSETPGAFTDPGTRDAWRIYAEISRDVRSRRALGPVDPMVSATEHELDQHSRVAVLVNNAPDERVVRLAPSPGWKVERAIVGSVDEELVVRLLAKQAAVIVVTDQSLS